MLELSRALCWSIVTVQSARPDPPAALSPRNLGGFFSLPNVRALAGGRPKIPAFAKQSGARWVLQQFRQVRHCRIRPQGSGC